MPVLTSHNFVEDLALVLCVASITTVVFEMLRQPVVVGYLAAGLIVGPNFRIPLFADINRIHALSELGVILLMFAIGLEFSLRKLVKLAPTAGFITVVQVGLLVWIGYAIGRALDWTILESVFTGAVLSISSTTIIARAFREEQAAESLRELVFGVALFEDLVAIVMLAILTAVATGAELSTRMVRDTVGRLAFFLAALIGVGFLIVPRAIRFVARRQRNEALLVASVGLCFAFAMIAQDAGYSVALGAFLAGVLVSESGFGERIEQLVAPLRDIFGAVFFVSVGMMLDPHVIVDYWPALVALTATVIFGKLLGVGIGAMLCGTSTSTSVQAGMAMGQIGEFSFIIAGVGVANQATRPFIYSLAIAVSAITTFLTPFMIRASGPVGRFVDARTPSSIGVLQALYGSWMERIRVTPRPGGIWSQAVMICASALSLAAIVIGYEFQAHRLPALIAAPTGLTLPASALLAKGVALGLCVLASLGVWRGSRGLARRLALDISSGAGERIEATRALTRMLEIAIGFATAILLLAAVAPFVSTRDGAAFLLVAVSILALMTWRSARQIRSSIHAAASRSVAGTKPPAEVSRLDQPPAAPSEAVAGASPFMSLRLPEGSGAVGLTIRDLNIRASTGAIVVAIARASGDVVMPAAKEILRAGDTLALVGSSQALNAAQELLDARTGAAGEPPAASSL